LADLQQWLLQTLVVWAESVIEGAGSGLCAVVASSDVRAVPAAPSWTLRLQHRLAHCVISCRTPQLFDMVKECVRVLILLSKTVTSVAGTQTVFLPSATWPPLLSVRISTEWWLPA
jgi:hypothetical protein